MRSYAEILARVIAVAPSDPFGTQRNDLIAALPYELAKPYLLDGITADDWTATPIDDAYVRRTIVQYMPFAWDKANHCRGLSAWRSLCHMAAWLWLLGDDALAATLDDYTHYGKPQLRAICEKYGINWRALDDGHWREGEDDAGVGSDDVPAIVIADA